MPANRPGLIRIAIGVSAVFFLLPGCLQILTPQTPINFGSVVGLHPSDEAITFSKTPKLRWTPSVNAVGYKIQFAETKEKVSGSKIVSVSETTYAPPDAFQSTRDFFWRICHIDKKGFLGAWSEIYRLEWSIGTISGKNPPSGAATTDTTPELRWSAVTGAARYKVKIADTEGGVADAPEVTVEGNSYTRVRPLADKKTYYWSVQPIDSDGRPGGWSQPVRLKVNKTGVGSLSPADGASVTDTTPELSWSAVKGATGYRVRIAETIEGLGEAQEHVVTDTKFTPGTALANNRIHFWRVRAVNGEETLALSAAQSLQVNWGTITGMNPANGATGTDTTPTLSWTAVAGATRYELQIADTETGVASADTNTFTAPTFTQTTALAFKTHYWRVRALDANGSFGAWSSTSGLQVNMGAVTGVSPANGAVTADTTPTLRWDTNGEAASYEVQIVESNTAPAWNNATIRRINAGLFYLSPQYTPTLAKNKTHFWRVRARSRDGQAGPWTASRRLQISWAVVSGLSPADGAKTTDTTPELKWDAVTGADKYQVRIADSEAALDRANPKDGNGPSFTPTDALANNKLHYWQVRAGKGTGQNPEYSAWSPARSIHVNWGAISAMVPAEGAATTDTTPTLTWLRVVGANGYEIQIASTKEGIESATITQVAQSGGWWLDANHTPSTALNNNSTHYWRVRAVKNDANGPWSRIRSLKVRIGSVGGLSPPNGGTTTDTNPTLNWTAIPGTDGYQVRIATSVAGLESDSTSTQNKAISGTQYTANPALASNGMYYWKVRAMDSANPVQYGEWSAVQSFEIRWDFITGLKPANGAATSDTTPELSWNAVAAAANYQLQIADTVAGLDNSTLRTVPAPSGATTVTHTTSTLTYGNHYWRVRAVQNAQYGEWSTAHKLRISSIVVNGLIPADGVITTDSTPKLQWAVVAGAASYDVQVAGTRDGLENAEAKEVTDPHHTPTLRDGTHYWRVRAVKGSGTNAQTGAWSSVHGLRVMGFVLVEGGTFLMGSETGPSTAEPAHQVTVGGFWISPYEITQYEYQSVTANNPGAIQTPGANSPKNYVNWFDAVRYCNKLSEREGKDKVYTFNPNGSFAGADFTKNGYRLPTEAEWEYAARGGAKSNGYTYAGGNDMGELAWYKGNSGGRFHLIGGKKANELGLYDMGGNLWEWCWDWYGAYGDAAETNPKGPSTGTYRGLRGGSWENTAGNCRPVIRHGSATPVEKRTFHGFRPVRNK